MAGTRKNVRAAIYCRISKDSEDTRLGVERQEKDCRKLCADRGWTVVDVYCDNDTSAADPRKKRPEYERLLKDIAVGEVEAVVVYAEDRLHRRPAELETFVAACDAAGLTKLASVSGDVNLNDPDALMMLRLKGAMAAREVAVLQRRIKRKLRDKAESGEFHGGKRPFGYEADGMTIRKSEAVLVREAAERILEGGSLRSIATDWNKRGIRTSWDKPINETGLRKMLTGARVVGLRQHEGEIIGKAKWPAILDEATWNHVCKILKDPTRRGPRPSRVYPLRGVLKCGKCGHWLAANPSNTGARRYACKTTRGGCGRLTLTADHVERHVSRLIVPLADMSDVRDALHAEEEGTAEALRELVLADANDARKLAEIDEMFANDEMSSQSYRRQSKIVRDRMEARNSRLNTLRGRTALGQFGGEVRPSWDEMSAEDQRAIILSILEWIEVGPVVRFGSNRFDPDRLTFKWRKAVDIKNVKLAFAAMKVRMNEQMQRNLRDPDWEPSGGFDGFLEDLPPSPYDGIDPETDLGVTIPGA